MHCAGLLPLCRCALLCSACFFSCSVAHGYALTSKHTLQCRLHHAAPVLYSAPLVVQPCRAMSTHPPAVSGTAGVIYAAEDVTLEAGQDQLKVTNRTDNLDRWALHAAKVDFACQIMRRMHAALQGQLQAVLSAALQCPQAQACDVSLPLYVPHPPTSAVLPCILQPGGDPC